MDGLYYPPCFVVLFGYHAWTARGSTSGGTTWFPGSTAENKHGETGLPSRILYPKGTTLGSYVQLHQLTGQRGLWFQPYAPFHHRS